MQLVITILAKRPTIFMADILTSISTCKCTILELSFADFSSTAAAYLLIEGSWNCLAKLETLLEHLQKRLDVKIYSLRLEDQESPCEYIPYNLEVVAINHECILEDTLKFLTSRHIRIGEIKANCYPASYTQVQLFSAKFILFIPFNIQILSFREELLCFCDSSNVDAIFEPIKR